MSWAEAFVNPCLWYDTIRACVPVCLRENYLAMLSSPVRVWLARLGQKMGTKPMRHAGLRPPQETKVQQATHPLARGTAH